MKWAWVSSNRGFHGINETRIRDFCFTYGNNIGKIGIPIGTDGLLLKSLLIKFFFYIRNRFKNGYLEFLSVSDMIMTRKTKWYLFTKWRLSQNSVKKPYCNLFGIQHNFLLSRDMKKLPHSMYLALTLHYCGRLWP